MAGTARNVAELIIETEGFRLDDATTAHFEAVTKSLDRLASETQQAVTTPTTEATSDGHDAIAYFEDHIAEAESHIKDARPEPLLELQRTITAFRQSGSHAADSLDIATHSAFRSTPAIFTDNA